MSKPLREYWLTIGEYLTISGHPVHNEVDTIHVTEVLPGHILISREMLRDAYEASKLDTHISEIAAIERELFGNSEGLK